MLKLIYVADPMCSWCYGFSPQLNALLAEVPHLSVQVVLGGLRPYTRDALAPGLRGQILQNWDAVHARSGLPFSRQTLDKEDFVYDTEPACRAVVVARMVSEAHALPVLQAIHQAFYAQGRDTTHAEVLADIWVSTMKTREPSMREAEFLALWNSDEAVQATREDFTRAQQLGATGFPTLLLERDASLIPVALGYLPMPELSRRLQNLLEDAPRS